ncbi:MAG: serine/threonine-protein kinase [Myxococcota bacterium]
MSDPAFITAPPDAEPSGARPPMFGQTVGRYLLLGAIGRGGSGEVFAAYDPVLDRKVAIKALWRGGAPVTSMVSEGRVLARLKHPNIVAIHDVIVDSDQAFLAMEYFRRGDLGTWIDEHPHTPWREAMPGLLALGRGLAAAHASEIIHGDVKPANVLVADDGRLCLSDFGIARAAAERAGSPEDGAPAEVAGTWAYMAPEQRDGAQPSERSDQYALSLVAWEVLTGKRRAMTDAPTNAAEDQETRGTATGRPADARSPLQPADGRSALPPRVLAILERGVAADPEARWPSIDAFVSALESAQSGRRFQLPALLAGGAAVAVAVLAATGGERCQAGQARLAGAWGAAQRESVARAVVATSVPDAQGVARRIQGSLDAYASAWAAMHNEACRATADGEQSDEALDLRMACLRRGRSALGAAARQLADADIDVVHNAHVLTDGLPSLEACADVEALRAVYLPIPPGQRPAVEQAEERLAEVEALRRAGRAEQAWTLAQDNAGRTADLDYPPLVADQAIVEASALSSLGRYDDALPRLHSAYAAAMQARDLQRAFRAVLKLSFHVGVRLDRHAEGLVYADIAQGMATALALPDRDLATLGSHRGSILAAQGKYEASAAEQERAIELRRRAGPKGELAGQLSNLGIALDKLGRYSDAVDRHQQAVDIRIETLGPEHPLTARAHLNVGNALAHAKEFGPAEASLRIGLEVMTAAHGAEHPDVLVARLNFASMLRRLDGGLEAAEAELRAIVGAAGPSAPGPKIAAAAHGNLANLLGNAGRDAEAAIEYSHAIAMLQSVVGPDHPEVASVRANLGVTYRKLGRLDDAEREHRLALRQLEAALGPDHPDLAYPLCGLGDLEIARGAPELGRDMLERCLAAVQRLPGQGDRVAQAKFFLVQAIWDSDRARARVLLGDAKKAAAVGKAIDGLDAWVAEHPE